MGDPLGSPAISLQNCTSISFMKNEKANGAEGASLGEPVGRDDGFRPPVVSLADMGHWGCQPLSHRNEEVWSSFFELREADLPRCSVNGARARNSVGIRLPT